MVPKLMLAIALLALCLLSASSVSASRAPEPQVICISTSGSIEQPEGSYAIRPPSCNFHQRGQSATYAHLLEMRHIHWLHWGSKVAVGRGKSLANMAGPAPTKVRLTAPETVCGHTVFTHASFDFLRIPGGYGPGMTLDNRLASATCR